MRFLFEPHPYKVLYGGRDGVKSWHIAIALLKLASEQPKRVLCARETQKSLEGSVRQLLADQIVRLGLERAWDVQQNKIVGKNGSVFTFAGLRHNPAAIKSAEGVDIVWVEEAQHVSKDSWDKLLPTIRKGGAEVWISFNPEFEEDPTYRYFITNPPPGAVLCETSWEDNRWLSEFSRNQIRHMQEFAPEDYAHIYGGKTKSVVHGAVYGEQIKAAMAEGRIGNVPIDRTKPVHTAWDLGFGDAMAIWFVQAYDGWWNFVDYLENNGESIDWYVIELQKKGYIYGVDYLPHDGVDAIIHHKLSGDRSKSVEQVMRSLGRNVQITPKLHVHSGINAARMFFSQCRFDAEKCQQGIKMLRMYQWGEPKDDGRVIREPKHDAASHAADAFRNAALAIQQPEPERQARPVERSWQPSGYSPFG